MIDPSIRDVLVREREGPILVLTGAGISAESGIPTFRGKDGYWTVGSRVYHPQELATHAAFRRMPYDVWRWYLMRRSACRAAAPNPAHLALAQLERHLGDRFVLVTQNVDGLHLRSGNTMERTFQIHGNIDFMRCSRGCCLDLTEVPDVLPSLPSDEHMRDVLVCSACGAPSRPHVLWFDEYYDEPLFRAESALQAAADAAILLVVGTAGATNLPLQIGSVAARRKIPILDVNVDDNPFGTLAQECDHGHALRGAASTLVPQLVAVIEGR